MALNNEVTFKGTVIRETYCNEDYRVYAIDVDKNIYPHIKFTKYNNAVITGEMHELAEGIEYEIKATEELTKYGYNYKVINIRRDKPHSGKEMYEFLHELLTENQCKALYEVYPDIVDRVVSGEIGDVDLSKLKGIGQKTFNGIVTKIRNNYFLMELVAHFKGVFSMSTLRKLYAEYSSLKLIENKLREDPYKCLCGLAGIGFSTADGILLNAQEMSKKSGDDKFPIEFDYELLTSKQRCLACIQYLLEQNESEGHTVMTITDLREQCIKLTPKCSQHFVDCLKDASIYYSKDLMIVALRTTYDTEQYIAIRIQGGLSDSNQWNIDTMKYRKVDEFELSDEQMGVLDNICQHNICILNGSAGTGKSSSTQALINMLEDNGKTFKLLAPTGKAAKVIAAYTGRDASTIHRGLGYMPPNDWCYNKENQIEDDVVIIDEFSMTDIFLFKHVLDAIDFSKTKLLLIGDNAQLPSVSCGNLLHDFMQSGVIPTTTLTKVFRYSDGGLMKVATDVRLGQQYLGELNSKLTWFGDNKDYAFINVGDDYVVRNAIGLYKKLLEQGDSVDNITVLTSYKKGEYGSVAINNAIQRVANPNYGSKPFMKVGETAFFIGDIVIQNANNYHAKPYKMGLSEEELKEYEAQNPEEFIANGETGRIIHVHPYYIVIDFDGVVVRYYRDDAQHIGLGYCITIHKSQGSSIDTVILLTPRSHTYMLNSNLIYVGMTRMRKQCYHFGTARTVNTAIKKKANFKRNTIMQLLLKNNGE